MRINLLFSALAAAIFAVPCTHAQDVGRNADARQEAANQQKSAARPRKVWTEDDVTASRPRAATPIQQSAGQTPSVQQKAVQAPSEGSAKQPASARTITDSKAAQRSAPPALSNPKTLAEADKMIAWENRDIQAQEEFVEKLRQQLNNAPADQRQHLLELLQERTQTLADLRREQQNLIAQRTELEKGGVGARVVSTSARPGEQ